MEVEKMKGGGYVQGLVEVTNVVNGECQGTRFEAVRLIPLLGRSRRIFKAC